MKKVAIYSFALVITLGCLSIVGSKAAFAQNSVKYKITNTGKTNIKVTFRRPDGSPASSSVYSPGTTYSGMYTKGGSIEYYCMKTKKRHSLRISDNPKNNVFNISCE